MNDVINRDKYQYEKTRTVDADGKARTTVSNGDAVARAMIGLSIEELNDIAEREGFKKSDLYKNTGLFRMALGNSLRAMVKKGTAVQIGDVLVKKLDQRVAVAEAKPPKAEKTGKRKVKEAA